MRIVYVTARMPFGVGEAFLIPEALELLRTDHDLLIVPRSFCSQLTHHDGAQLVDKSLREGLISGRILCAALFETIRSPIKVAALLILLAKSRTVSSFAQNCAVLLKSIWLARVARQFKADHIHAHWASSSSTLAMFASIVSGIPWSMTAHRGDIVENNLLSQKLKRASFVRFISCSGVKLARTVAGHEIPMSASVIRMGVCSPNRMELPSAALQLSPPVFFCPASLYLVKGHQYLIRAAAILKSKGLDFEVQLAGEGGLREELIGLAKSLDVIDRVHFLGQVSHSEIIARYQQGTVAVVVLASVDLGNGLHEGIPVSLMEAMAYQIPVISTLTGGIPELLGDGTGLLVPHSNAEALASAMGQLIATPDMRSKLAKAGRLRIEEEYAVNRVVGKLIAAIEAGNRPDAKVRLPINDAIATLGEHSILSEQLSA